MWDLIVSVPDHCLSFYFSGTIECYSQNLGDNWAGGQRYGLSNLSILWLYIRNVMNLFIKRLLYWGFTCQKSYFETSLVNRRGLVTHVRINRTLYCAGYLNPTTHEYQVRIASDLISIDIYIFFFKISKIYNLRKKKSIRKRKAAK